MHRRRFLQAGMTVGLTSALASVPGLAAAARARFRSATPQIRRRRRFPNLHLITHEGRTVRLYDDLVKGKTVIFHFMYTSCTQSCPLTTANLARVRDLLGARVGRDVFLYSITVDPGYDTPARLLDYARRVGVKPGWTFLTGKPEDISALRTCFGENLVRDPGESNHLNLLAFGVEPLERWAACPAQLNPKWIVRYLSWLDPKGERPNGWWPAGHGLPGA